jgi:hypothetical protein
MPHFMKLISQMHLGAINFTDESMRPIKRKLVIDRVTAEVPPGAGKNSEKKNYVRFRGMSKGAFFSNKQLKKIANELMCADTDKWVGVELEVTCAEVKSREGGMTMGMIVTSIQRLNEQKQVDVKKIDQVKSNSEPNPDNDGRE